MVVVKWLLKLARDQEVPGFKSCPATSRLFSREPDFPLFVGFSAPTKKNGE